jgi:hypothetical protein
MDILQVWRYPEQKNLGCCSSLLKTRWEQDLAGCRNWNKINDVLECIRMCKKEVQSDKENSWYQNEKMAMFLQGTCKERFAKWSKQTANIDLKKCYAFLPQGNNFQVTKTCNKISELLSCEEANFSRQQINKLGQKKHRDFGSLWLHDGLVVDNEAPICTTVLSRIRTKQMLLQIFFNGHNNISYTDLWTA